MGLPEEVFDSGTDDAGRRLVYGRVTIATNENNRGALRFAHQQTGSCGELVGGGKNRGGKRASPTGSPYPPGEEEPDARRPRGNRFSSPAAGGAQPIPWC